MRLRDPLRVLRALLAGAAATLVDLGVLALLVSVLGVSARAANVPALVAGGVVSFFGNRHFAVRAARAPVGRQALLYTAVELAALALNGLLFELAMRALANHPELYGLVRLATSHVVFLAWSYPLWRLVFRVPARA